MKVDVEKPLVGFPSLFGGWAVSLETPGFASPDCPGFAIVGELQKLFVQQKYDKTMFYASG